MTSQLPRRRSILYVSPLERFSTARYRYESVEHLNQEVHAFDLVRYARSTRVGRWIQFRYPVGPIVARVNRELRKTVNNLRPEVVWFEKPTVFTAETMQAIKQTGAQIVFYIQDSPFGLRNDGCWLQFNKVFRMADLHCLVRQADVGRYSSWQLPFIQTMFSFDRRVHFPPNSGFGDAQRDREVSYIGHPHEQRPAFMVKLARDYRLPVFVNGNLWSKILSPEELQLLTAGGALLDSEYRSGIWKSKINLSFVTADNEDDIAHKAVEIAACAGFLLALRTPGHQAIFEEDREAVFFSSVEECADKCRFYLGRPDLREAIGLRGRERAVRDGYDNDTQLARVLNRLDGNAD